MAFHVHPRVQPVSGQAWSRRRESLSLQNTSSRGRSSSEPACPLALGQGWEWDEPRQTGSRGPRVLRRVRRASTQPPGVSECRSCRPVRRPDSGTRGPLATRLVKRTDRWTAGLRIPGHRV